VDAFGLHEDEGICMVAFERDEKSGEIKRVRLSLSFATDERSGHVQQLLSQVAEAMRTIPACAPGHFYGPLSSLISALGDQAEACVVPGERVA